MYSLEDIEKLTKEIESIILVFKKNPNREFSEAYLESKIATVDANNKKFSIIEKHLKNKIKKEILEYYLEKYLDKYNALKEILDKFITTELNLSSTSSIYEDFEIDNNGSEDRKIEEIRNMASFDIMHTVKLIPEYNGEANQLTNFINLVEYLHNTLKDEEKPKLIEFITKTKLSEKTRKKIPNNIKIETLEELKNIFQKTFKTNRSELVVQSELMSATQGNNTLTNYIDKIQNLTFELSNLQMNGKSKLESEVISVMNERMAMNIFKQGIHNSIKTVVLSARVESLQDAINLATEAEASKYTANIYNYKTSSYRQNNNKRGQNYNRARNFTSKYHNNNDRRNNNRRTNINNNDNYNKNNNGFNNRNNYNNRANYNTNNNRNNYKSNNSRNNNSNNRRNVNHISGNEMMVPEDHHSRN